MGCCLLLQEVLEGTSLVAHWLRLHAPNAGGTGLVPGRGTKVPDPACCKALPQTKRVSRRPQGVSTSCERADFLFCITFAAMLGEKKSVVSLQSRELQKCFSQQHPEKSLPLRY